jgi:hypothetical protein
VLLGICGAVCCSAETCGGGEALEGARLESLSHTFLRGGAASCALLARPEGHACGRQSVAAGCLGPACWGPHCVGPTLCGMLVLSCGPTCACAVPCTAVRHLRCCRVAHGQVFTAAGCGVGFDSFLDPAGHHALAYWLRNQCPMRAKLWLCRVSWLQHAAVLVACC